jgi:hypothetical protein
MSCANVAAKEGISAEDAAAQIRANMTRAEKPANEVANTIQKAYRETGRNYTNMHIMTAQERNSYRASRCFSGCDSRQPRKAGRAAFGLSLRAQGDRLDWRPI